VSRDRLATLLIFVAVVSVGASATHALHLPDLLGEMHAHHVAMAWGPTVPAFAEAESAVDEVWCAVEGFLPMTALLVIAALASFVPLWLAAQPRMPWSPSVRTRPPPLRGSRLRAALQVFRN